MKNKLFSNGELKKRYKMYKAGKYMLIAPLIFAGLFVFTPQTAKADQTTSQTTTEAVSSQATSEDNKAISSDQSTQSATTASDTEATSVSTDVTVSNDNKTSDAASKNNSTEATSSQQTTTSANAQLYTTSLAATTTQSSIDVSDADGLYNALKGNYSIINITNDINFKGTYYSKGNGLNKISNSLTSQTITINGNSHTIDFDMASFDFVKKKNQAMSLTINDLTMYGSNYWGPFLINIRNEGDSPATGVTREITYNNVNYTGSKLLWSNSTTVYIKGTVNVNSVAKYSSKFNSNVTTQGSGNQQNIEANSIYITAGAKFTGNTDHSASLVVLGNSGAGLVIEDGASVKLYRNNKGTEATTDTSGKQSVLYSNGKVTIGKNVTLDVDASSTAFANFPIYHGLIYLNNTGSMTVGAGSVVNVGTTLNGTFNTPLIYVNGNGQLDINGTVNVGNENVNTSFSCIYIDGSGAIRVRGSEAALTCISSGTDTQNYIDGVINITGGGNFFVSDGAALTVKNLNSTKKDRRGEYLIRVDGTSTLAFSNRAKVNLLATGAGDDAILAIEKGAHITIDRPDYVIFDLQSTGSESVLFAGASKHPWIVSFNGDTNARYVKIQDSVDGTPVGPFETANYTITNGSTTSTNFVGLTADDVAKGEAIANNVNKLHYLKYTADDTDNFIHIANRTSLTTETTKITGTTTANAYVTLYYYGEDGSLTSISGVNNNTVVLDTAGTKLSYAVQADANGNYSIDLPSGGLTANGIIVAKSTKNFTTAFDTAFIHTDNNVIQRLKNVKAKAEDIVTEAETANTKAKTVVTDHASRQAVIDANNQTETTAQSIADQAQEAIDSYEDPAALGNNAANEALKAIEASQAADEAKAINDLTTYNEQTAIAKTATTAANNDVEQAVTNITKLSAKATELEEEVSQLKVQYATSKQYTITYRTANISINADNSYTGDLTSAIYYYAASDFSKILSSDLIPEFTTYSEYTGNMGSFRSGWGLTNGISTAGTITFVKDQLASAASGEYYLPVNVHLSDGTTVVVLQKLNLYHQTAISLVNNYNVKITGTYNGTWTKGATLDNSKLTLHITADNGVDQTLSGDKLYDLVATAGDGNQVTLKFGSKFAYHVGLLNSQSDGLTATVKVTTAKGSNSLLRLFSVSFVVNPAGQILSTNNLTVQEDELPSEESDENQDSTEVVDTKQAEQEPVKIAEPANEISESKQAEPQTTSGSSAIQQPAQPTKTTNGNSVSQEITASEMDDSKTGKVAVNQTQSVTNVDTDSVQTNQNIVKNDEVPAEPVASTTNSRQSSLPQTGNHDSAVAGLGLMSLTALLSLFGIRKRHN